ncbi:sensor histidine kinase [Salibacterium aidingense]|uniref:sensor histidine kinase n=1 Tax=Salibacterium aidingense TaxID=384933 RepID=UPI0003FD71AE|nr:HAMP domain-containing sensor histidine kinase [Salibacterium aidingense]
MESKSGMKWKLTGSYLFSIVSIVFIVILVNTFIIVGMLWYQHLNTTGAEGESNSSETFTRNFDQYMQMENEEVTVSEEGTNALEEYGAWLQILDNNGQVVSSYSTPGTVSDHYSPMELVHKYKYMDDELNTYFLGEYGNFSYIVGIPDSDDERFVFTVDVESMISNVSQVFLVIIFVDLVIAAMIGLLFSSILIKPVNTMIERISHLKHMNFGSYPAKKPGIFKSVFANLNEVSSTLSKHDKERMKLENMRKEWISNVSHDLKTPLASMQGYAELLQDKEVDAQERIEYAEVIERQSVYIKDLIDDLNLTMRLQNDEMPMQLQETRIEPFVKEIVIDVLNDPQYKDRDISFTSDHPEKTLYIDPHLMKRAILNFIYNALMHNEEDVAVAVTLSDHTISIDDNGKGISGDIDRVFERHYRGTNTNNSKGTGLGMAIARNIVTAHGWDVEITSHMGQGTNIKIRFAANF